MKHPSRSNLLPLFPALAGVLGLILRIWLFSTIDEKGLLPAKHIADTLLYILTAVTLGILFLATRDLRSIRNGSARLTSILGCILGSAGLLFTGLLYLSNTAAQFSAIAAAACIAGSITLLAMAILMFLRKDISYGFGAILTVCLILYTVTNCKSWGTVSQLQEYFFPLMAAIFLILSAYHFTLLSASQGKPQQLAFFSQGALFFCCVCLNTVQWPLYLGMLCWAAVQLYLCIPAQKEA